MFIRIFLAIFLIINIACSQKIKWRDLTPQTRKAIMDSIHTIVKEYSYGDNIQNFLWKADGRYKRFDCDTLKILYIGDSITGNNNTWCHFFQDTAYINAVFPNTEFDISRITWGGYSPRGTDFMFFEDAVISPNIDLFVISDFDKNNPDYLYQALIHIIEQVRSRSTADIMIYTRNPTTVTNLRDASRVLRRIGMKYNCEVIDVWERFMGDSRGIASLMGSETHPNEEGHNLYHAEFKQHVDTLGYNKVYNSNYAIDVEEILEFEDPIFLYDSTKIDIGGTWTATLSTDVSHGYLTSTTLNDSVEIIFNGVGFDLYYLAGSGYGDFSIVIDDSIPSAIRINSRPLIYASMPTWDSGNSNADWNHRLFKILFTDTTETGTWEIVVADTSADSVYVVNPSSDTVATGRWTADISGGDILIPVTYGGNDNWLGEDDYEDGDKFAFTVYKNYTDTVETDGSTAQKKVRVFGLENKEHTLKIQNTDGNAIYLDAIRFFRPLFGRE